MTHHTSEQMIMISTELIIDLEIIIFIIDPSSKTNIIKSQNDIKMKEYLTQCILLPDVILDIIVTYTYNYSNTIYYEHEEPITIFSHINNFSPTKFIYDGMKTISTYPYIAKYIIKIWDEIKLCPIFSIWSSKQLSYIPLKNSTLAVMCEYGIIIYNINTGEKLKEIIWKNYFKQTYTIKFKLLSELSPGQLIFTIGTNILYFWDSNANSEIKQIYNGKHTEIPLYKNQYNSLFIALPDGNFIVLYDEIDICLFDPNISLDTPYIKISNSKLKCEFQFTNPIILSNTRILLGINIIYNTYGLSNTSSNLSIIDFNTKTVEDYKIIKDRIQEIYLYSNDKILCLVGGMEYSSSQGIKFLFFEKNTYKEINYKFIIGHHKIIGKLPNSRYIIRTFYESKSYIHIIDIETQNLKLCLEIGHIEPTNILNNGKIIYGSSTSGKLIIYE